MPQATYAPVHQQAEGDPRLAQLAAIAQIYGGLNGQANQQGQNQQQNALAILGLMLQHEHQQELLGVQKAGQEQNQNQFLAQQTQSQAELGAKNTWEQQKIKADKQASEQALTRTGLTNAAGLPGMTPEVYAKLAEAAGVHGFAPFNAANESAIVNRNVGELKPLFGGLYSQFQDHPKQAQQSVNTLWTDPRMQNPKVQEMLRPYLNELDASLYNPQAPGVVPTTPEAVLAQRGDQRTGGLFGVGGTFDLRDQTPPAVIAQRNAYQQAHPEVVGNPPGILDWLLGKNKNVGSIYK